jgi:hypothetical protein
LQLAGLLWADLERADRSRQILVARRDVALLDLGQLACPDRQLKSATMTIRRAVQQFVWQHGCADAKPCGRKNGAHCPQRHSGGVVTTDVKSRAGRRTVGMPAPLVHEIERHRERQALERAHAANLWREEGWGLHQPTRRPGAPDRGP